MGADGMNYIVEFEGTLADTDGCFASVFSEAFSQFGMPFDEARLQEYLSVPLDVLFARFYTGCTCKFRDFVTFFIGSFDRHFSEVEPVPGMAERVNGLRREGCRVAVISGCYEMYVRSFLQKFSIGADCVVGLDRMPSGIPDADALKLCMNEINCEPDSVCFIGGERLGSFAKEIGMKTGA